MCPLLFDKYYILKIHSTHPDAYQILKYLYTDSQANTIYLTGRNIHCPKSQNLPNSSIELTVASTPNTALI